MSQSRAYSLIEAVANVVVGYGLAVATQIVIFPVFGLRTSLRDDLTIGAVFSGVSLVRSYALRRLFERFRARPADLPPAPVAPTSGVERVDPSTAVDLLAADRQPEPFLQGAGERASDGVGGPACGLGHLGEGGSALGAQHGDQHRLLRALARRPRLAAVLAGLLAALLTFALHARDHGEPGLGDDQRAVRAVRSSEAPGDQRIEGLLRSAAPQAIGQWVEAVVGAGLRGDEHVALGRGEGHVKILRVEDAGQSGGTYEPEPRRAGERGGPGGSTGVFAFAEGLVAELAQVLRVAVEASDMAPVHSLGLRAEMVVAERLQPGEHRVDLGFAGHEGVEGFGAGHAAVSCVALDPCSLVPASLSTLIAAISLLYTSGAPA